MSEPDSPTRRGELHHHQQQQQQQLHQSVEERDEANNSIIGKVRSRVSSIFPQQLTKWFSPAVPSAATSNGGVGGASRRRRRSEEDDNSNDDNDMEASDHSGGEDADEYSSPATAQPPSKRSRLNIEATRTNFKNSESLISSTPALHARPRSFYSSSLREKRNEPAYNFGAHIKQTTTTTTTTNISRSVIQSTSTPTAEHATNIIDVVPERNVLNTSINSRRSLNIPSSSTNESHRLQNDFKRQPMMSLRTGHRDYSYQMPQSASKTTIAEGNDDVGDANNDDDDDPSPGATQTINQRDVEDDNDDDDDDENDESEEIAKATSKKPSTFTNGNRIGRSSSIATESGESRSSSVAQQTAPIAKPGLFNQANRGLRTMSGNGLNFYSHLEGRKSLFSEKNMPGMLNNSTLSLTSLNRRQFNSSIYGSTSALSDSRLLNTSSPFYKGQTTYGGAAAYSKFNRNINQSIRIAPTLIRPTSSLSTLSSSTNSLAQGANDQPNSTAISSTAKRILELINDFSTPLNDAKKMASNIKTSGMLRNAATAGKRFSEADLASARSVRLSSVRKPYTRPAVTLNPNNNNNNNDSKKLLLPPLKELQVPSMSQLLQMKKMQNCTERSRQIANTSKSALNRDCEYKLPFDGEQDRPTAAQKQNTDKQSGGKIKNKVTASSRVSSKNTHVEDEEPPAPVNLPNIAFPFMQSVPKIDIAVNTPQQKPKTDFKFAPSSEAKPTNNFSFGIAAKEPEKSKSTATTTAMNFNFTSSSSTPSSGVTTTLSASLSSASSEFKFSSPVSVNCTPSKSDVAPINNFKFSSPVIVEQKADGGKEKTPTFALPTAVPQLKTGSVLDALKKQTSDKPPSATPISAASSFGDMFKKPANEWECSACMLRNKETLEKCVACETPRSKPAAAVPNPTLPSTNSFPTIKNTFGEAFKPKSDTWECSACMVRNKNDANECVACCTKKPGAAVTTAATAAPKIETTDAGFKSLVAQQKASKWECDACMTRNDAERNKCVCCEQAKPGTQVVSDSVPQFSFGTSSASKFTFGFGGAAAGAAKKEDELKAAAAAAASTASSKTENKTGFTFGMPTTTTTTTAVKTNDTSSSSSSASSAISGTGFTFGIKPIQANTTSKDVPDVVKTNTTAGFKFGVPSSTSTSSLSAAAASSKSTDSTTSTGFSFGLKPATMADTKETPASTASTAESKANSAVTSTTTTPATSSLFNPTPQSAFGGLRKAGEEVTTKPAETKGLLFGIPASGSSSAASTPAAAIKPITFNAPAAKASETNNKSPPKVTFGSASTASSAVSTSTPSSAFVFGKPTTGTPAAAPSAFGTANAAASTTPSTTGFTFGKDPSPSSGSLFGAAAGANVSSKSATAATSLFGAVSATPAASAAATAASSATVSSSTTGFVFGKPATTSLFGGAAAAAATPSSAPAAAQAAAQATSSLFGSKPATTLFSTAVSTTSLAMPISTITSSSISSTPQSAAPFVFGSSAAGASSAANTNNKPIFGTSTFEAASTTPATTTSSWPTNSFSFGSTKPPESEPPKTNAPPAFGSPASIFGQTTPMFGSSQPQQQQVGEVKPMAAATPSAIPSFGAPTATSTIFGSSNAQSSATGGLGAAPTSNIFGSASSTPVFGSSSSSMGFEGFGAPAAAAAGAQPVQAAPTNSGNTTNPAAMPTFGSSSAFSSGFGSLAAASSSGIADGAPAPKKSDMAFNFGSAQSSTNTGFSFGSNNNKPASDSVFKFSTTSTPSFNFTGASEGSNSGGPFQFNAAGPTAATNNIFAPMPTPGVPGSQQAARRKMRTMTRRTQPR